MSLEEMTKKELIAEVEKAEAELEEYKTINPKEYDWVAENQRLTERVRELEKKKEYIQIVTQIQTIDICYQGAGLNIEDAIIQLSLLNKKYAEIAQREGYPRIAQKIRQVQAQTKEERG